MSVAKRSLVVIGLVLGLTVAPLAGQAWATLNLFQGFQNAALSIDAACAIGCNAEQNALQTDVPSNATVVAAYLYVADIFGGNAQPNGSVVLAGNTLNLSTFTRLTPNVNPANTYRLDVTSIMKPIIEGTGGLQTHSYVENFDMDGAVLVVAYRNASTQGGTAIILDGELALQGDTTTLGFSSPYQGGDVIMSMADSFSFQPAGQFTRVDITTSSNSTPRRLTGCAGGQDDGGGFDGGLITAGGIGDSPTNPNVSPCFDGDAGGPRADDELYNLALGNDQNPAGFLTKGDTSVTFNTINPSNNDNVFALFFTSDIQVSEVDDTTIPTDDGGPPPTGVPAPATLLLVGLGILGTALAGRKR
jgi:PEP-CTERM motif-containing protein